MKTLYDLLQAQCQPTRQCLAAAERDEWLRHLTGWHVDQTGQAIVRRYEFEDFDQTIAFVNAVANIAREQDHHPRLIVDYRYCEVIFSTHSAGGITRNDLICAARLNAVGYS